MKWWQRLQQEIDGLGWTMAELHRRSGISYDSLNKYLRGDVENPRGNVMDKLAAAIDRPTLWLKEGIDPSGMEISRSNGRPVSAPVVATVEAGAWREVDQFDQSEHEWIAVEPDKKFPHATQEIYDVSGDSMNQAEPHPIKPGAKVVAVRYEDVVRQVPLRDGLIVVVQRTRGDGQEREISIKEVAWFDDRIEFRPRSSNPKHKPIVVQHDSWEDNGVTVEVLALVRSVINEMPV